MATTDQRQHMKAIMDLLLSHRNLIPYVQARPITWFEPLLYEQDVAHQINQAKPLPGIDCSGIVIWLCHAVGMRDPSGQNYNGDGDTQDIYDHLPHYTTSAPGLGVPVVFGADIRNPLSNQHVALVYQPPIQGNSIGNTMLFSHGSSAGPITLTLDEYRQAVPSQGEGVFCNIMGL